MPTRPSALSGPCQTSFHCAPSAITPGIAVTVTCFSAAGWGNFRAAPPPPSSCAIAIPLRTTAAPRTHAMLPIVFNLIFISMTLQLALPARRAKARISYLPPVAGVYTDMPSSSRARAWVFGAMTKPDGWRQTDLYSPGLGGLNRLRQPIIAEDGGDFMQLRRR